MPTRVFAYGSMMNEAELRHRCASARFAFRARFPDRELCFPRYSQARGSGVAGLEKRIGASAWGVVWEIPDAELSVLDQAEGYQPGRARDFNSYNRIPCVVFRDGDDSHPEAVDFYDAVPATDVKAPSAAYLGLIIEGAKQHDLPLHYIDSIAARLKCRA